MSRIVGLDPKFGTRLWAVWCEEAPTSEGGSPVLNYTTAEKHDPCGWCGEPYEDHEEAA